MGLICRNEQQRMQRPAEKTGRDSIGNKLSALVRESRQKTAQLPDITWDELQFSLMLLPTE
jgi:hypothetical protein